MNELFSDDYNNYTYFFHYLLFRPTSREESFFTKLVGSFNKNKITVVTGISAAIIGATALHIYNLNSAKSKPKDGQDLKTENNTLKDLIIRTEKKLLNMELKIEDLENALSNQGLMCAICQDNTLARTFVPCGHSVCDPCSLKVSKCPFCNEIVDQIIIRY